MITVVYVISEVGFKTTSMLLLKSSQELTLIVRSGSLIAKLYAIVDLDHICQLFTEFLPDPVKNNFVVSLMISPKLNNKFVQTS